MGYSVELGRQFWHDFDNHFKYQAASNGLLQTYVDMGGQDAAANAWQASRSGVDSQAFARFTSDHAKAITQLADAQKSFYIDHFPNRQDLVMAFRDFAFGVLESPDAEHRVQVDDHRHGMSGGQLADGYLHWHGFIEAAAALEPEDDFWPFLRRVNGMAWELHVRSHPGEVDPDKFEPLPDAETEAVREKWFSMSDDAIASAFDDYVAQSRNWASEAA